MIEVFPISALRDNYVWVLADPDRGCAAVVDPGESDPVVAGLAERGLRLTAILITHHHPDHVGGVDALVERFGVPVYGPARESIPQRAHALAEGDVVELDCPAVRLRVLDIPGHTSGHIAYFGDGMLFSGDTLFAAGCGRVFEGTFEQMHEALGKLAALPGETRIYCGHEYTEANLRFASKAEPQNQAVAQRLRDVQAQRKRGECTLPSTMAQEWDTNPFLRSDQPNVIQNAERHAGHGLSSPVDVFATVRRWKDGGG